MFREKARVILDGCLFPEQYSLQSAEFENRGLNMNFFIQVAVVDKGCLKICVDNLRNVHLLSAEEMFGILQYLAVFLQHAFDRTQTMLDDFRIAQGFHFLVDLGLRYVFPLTLTELTSVHCVQHSANKWASFLRKSARTPHVFFLRHL